MPRAHNLASLATTKGDGTYSCRLRLRGSLATAEKLRGPSPAPEESQARQKPSEEKGAWPGGDKVRGGARVPNGQRVPNRSAPLASSRSAPRHGGNPGVCGVLLGAAHPARGPRRGEADPLRGRGKVGCQDGFASFSPVPGLGGRSGSCPSPSPSSPSGSGGVPGPGVRGGRR